MIVFKDFFFLSLSQPRVADIAESRVRKKKQSREGGENESEKVILLKDICRGSF